MQKIQTRKALPKPKAPTRQFAMMDRTHLVTGLFQAPIRNRKPEPFEDTVYLNNNKIRLDIKVPSPLTAFDATLLCVALNKAKTRKDRSKTISPDNINPVAVKLREDMQLGKDALHEKTKIYRTSMRELIKEMNLPWAGKRSIEMIRDSMWRMLFIGFRVRYYNEKGNVEKEEIFNMMSFAQSRTDDDQDGKLIIHFNVILAKLLLDAKNFIKIYIDDLLELKGNAQIVYMQLCKLPSGQKKFITREEARAMLYGKLNPKDNKNTINVQRTRAIKTVEHVITTLSGWTILEKTSEGLLIRREEDTRTPIEFYANYDYED